MPSCPRAALLAAFVTLGLPVFGSPIMDQSAMSQSAAKPVTTSSGLQIIDTKPGTGAAPRTGQTVVVHYTGWLYANGAKGKKFDSSVDRNEPFEFAVGAGRVIRGWDEGVGSMAIGGHRILVIPPALAYGDRDLGDIPPNSTLVFDVELLSAAP